jgi:hypothetical protein
MRSRLRTEALKILCGRVRRIISNFKVLSHTAASGSCGLPRVIFVDSRKQAPDIRGASRLGVKTRRENQRGTGAKPVPFRFATQCV